MKIQCDVCERAEAALLCCADEAALCWSCDEKVHAANKLAGKHQRVPLLTPAAGAAAGATDQMPTCDICQEKAGYFFCLEDRALLCRNCDVGIHAASPYGTSHQRFLITGVRVALQHYLANNNNTTSSCNNSSTNNDRSNSSSSNGNSINNYIMPQASNSLITNKKPWTTPTNFCVEEGEGIRAQLMWNEVFDSAGFGQCYGISEPGSSS